MLKMDISLVNTISCSRNFIHRTFKLDVAAFPVAVE